MLFVYGDVVYAVISFLQDERNNIEGLQVVGGIAVHLDVADVAGVGEGVVGSFRQKSYIPDLLSHHLYKIHYCPPVLVGEKPPKYN